jgi:HEAT repeat protein
LIQSFLKALAIISIFSFSQQTFANSDAHGGGSGGEKSEPTPKPEKKMRGSFTEEQMEEMRLYQHLGNISSPNYQVSEYATFFFEQRGEKVIPPLLNLLKHKKGNQKVESAIIYTFGRMGPKAARAVPIITKYLIIDGTEDIKMTSLAALGKIGKASDPSVPEIAKFLDADNEWMRTLALRSLREINTPQAKAIANVYEKKLKLEEERKNRELLGQSGNSESQPAATQPQPTN